MASLAGAAPRRVALAAGAPNDAVAVRLRAELVAAGFAVVDMEAWPPDTPARSVAARLRPSGAAAAIRLDQATLDVWVVEPQALPRAVLKEVIRSPATDPNGDLSITLRAVEIVRAELASSAEPRRGPGAALWSEGNEPAGSSDATAESRGPFAVDVALGASASPGGSTAIPALLLGAAWFPFERAGLGALVVASPFSSSVEAAEGSAQLWPGWVGGGIVLAPTAPEARFGLRLEPGFAAAWLHMEGYAKPLFTSQSDTVVAAAGYVRVAVVLRLTPLLALEAGAAAAATVPRVVISFADREVGAWGRPVALGFAGIELRP